jgi:arginine N-succinyltransferase
MGPITHDGHIMLWEFLGRRFIPLSYSEADKACQYSREFIASLLPREEIYLSLLPPEARDAVGRVNEETVPARAMLEKMGFVYKDRIDPFDGGPHLEAVTNAVPALATTRRMTLGQAINTADCDERAIVSMLSEDGEFRAVDSDVCFTGRSVSLPKSVVNALGWAPGASVGVTPMGERRKKPGAAPRKVVKKVRQ